MKLSKISRLPKSLRDHLNSRLADGHFGSELLKWLNALPEVQDITKLHFDDKPISKQNLSDWKNGGGYQNWLLNQNTLELGQRITEHTDDLEETLTRSSRRQEAQTYGPPSQPESDSDSEEPRPPTLPDRLALWLTARCMVLAQQFKSDTLDDAAWKRFHELTKQVIALRRGEQHSQRIQLQREQFEHSVKDEMTLAWNVCVDAARGHRDVMDRLRGALNLLQKRKNRDYRAYEADGETLSETVRRAPEPIHSRPESPDESSFVKLSPEDSEDGGCVGDQQTAPEPPTTSTPTIRHSSLGISPSRPTCTPAPAKSPDESSFVKLSAEASEDTTPAEVPISPIIPISPTSEPCETGASSIRHSEFVIPTPPPTRAELLNEAERLALAHAIQIRTLGPE